MTTETVTEVKDDKTEWIRGELSFLQSKMDIIGPILGKAYIRKHIALWRRILTVHMKQMPRLKALHSFLRQPVYNVRDLVQRIEYPSSYRDMSIKQLKYVLEFPERYRDSYKDMMNDHVEHKDRIRAYMLKNRQTAAGEPDPLVQPQTVIDEKEVDRVYKKYKKAFKEDNLTVAREFVDDYYRRKRK